MTYSRHQLGIGYGRLIESHTEVQRRINSGFDYGQNGAKPVLLPIIAALESPPLIVNGGPPYKVLWSFISCLMAQKNRPLFTYPIPISAFTRTDRYRSTYHRGQITVRMTAFEGAKPSGAPFTIRVHPLVGRQIALFLLQN